MIFKPQGQYFTGIEISYDTVIVMSKKNPNGIEGMANQLEYHKQEECFKKILLVTFPWNLSNKKWSSVSSISTYNWYKTS